jgi:diguanylate cyclase (GGDEF)-like protein
MPDISKRLEKAEKFLQKGRQDAALEEYLAALQEDPGNEQVLQTSADLCLALSRGTQAAELLTTLFDRQAAGGDPVRAAATYKKLARVAVPEIHQTFRYAQLVEKTSRRDALDAYSVAVQGFLRAGNKQEAYQALKRIIGLDPSEANFRREGELAAALGDNSAAAAAFLRVGQLQQNLGGDALPWFERAHQLDPQSPETALFLGRCLQEAGRCADAINVLAPFATGAHASVEHQDTYAKALLGVGRLAEAEPLVWTLFQRTPKQHQSEVEHLVGAFLDSNQHEAAIDLAHKLEVHQLKAGNQREFVALMKEITDRYQPSADFLEYMVEVFNSANREHDYCETLLKLFELYYADGNFIKAADCLDRAAEVDPYETGHERRLGMLRGKIDTNHYNAIASRFNQVQKMEEEQAPAATLDSESTVLEDLMLQAEIFLQYSMRSKAVERLERIHKLFPREEEQNEKLRLLYANAGMTPQYADARVARAPSPAAAAPVPPAAPGAPVPRAVADENAVDNFARVTAMTRNIYRQGSVKGVLFTAVNEIGRHWNVSRCVVGLCTPGKPPAATMEYCAPGVPQSDIVAMVKLILACQSIAVDRGTVTLFKVPGAPQLDSIREFVQLLNIESLLAVPLFDGDEHAGIIILEQCGAVREWTPHDEIVLKTIADQVVLAVNNSRLRSLVKTLAVTDEKSGLLKRSSYFDVLLSEVQRSVQQSSPLTLLLMHFGKTSALVREYGEPAVESMMQQVGQIVTSHIRQTDVAVRYDLASVALLLGDTGEKNGFFVVDKLRKVLGSVRLPGRNVPLPMTVGLAEAVLQARFDPVDLVTELINRAENALEAAKAEGPNSVKSLAPVLESAASAD